MVITVLRSTSEIVEHASLVSYCHVSHSQQRQPLKPSHETRQAPIQLVVRQISAQMHKSFLVHVRWSFTNKLCHNPIHTVPIRATRHLMLVFKGLVLNICTAHVFIIVHSFDHTNTRMVGQLSTFLLFFNRGRYSSWLCNVISCFVSV